MGWYRERSARWVVAWTLVALAATGGCGTRVRSKLNALVAATAATPLPPPPLATTSTVNTGLAVAEITANWEKFFAAATSLADRQALLESGPQMHDALVTGMQNPLLKEASAVVHSVSLTAPDRAQVSYDVLLNGSPALPAASGVAVLQDGVWKVSDQTFCSVVTLAGKVPGCS